MNNRYSPPFTISPSLQSAIDEVLNCGETPGDFMEASLYAEVRRRKVHRDFVDRAIAARDKAKLTGKYVTTDEILNELESMLKSGSG